MLKITPADKASIDAIERQCKHTIGDKYAGMAKALKSLEVGQSFWVQCPDGMTIARHQNAVASNISSFMAYRGGRFMTRRDAANNRVAVIRVE